MVLNFLFFMLILKKLSKKRAIDGSITATIFMVHVYKVCSSFSRHIPKSASIGKQKELIFANAIWGNRGERKREREISRKKEEKSRKNVVRSAK